MTLIKWDPFRELWGLERGINRALFDSSRNSGTEDSSGNWVPPVDIFEKGEDLVIRAELPGIDRKEIEVSVEDGTLTLRGERKCEKESEGERTYRRERVHGVFTRRIGLPTTVDANAIKATHKDGVLELVVPKSEQAKPRRVEIAAA